MGCPYSINIDIKMIQAADIVAGWLRDRGLVNWERTNPGTYYWDPPKSDFFILYRQGKDEWLASIRPEGVTATIWGPALLRHDLYADVSLADPESFDKILDLVRGWRRLPFYVLEQTWKEMRVLRHGKDRHRHGGSPDWDVKAWLSLASEIKVPD